MYIQIYTYIIPVKFSVKRLTATSVRPNYTNKLMLNSACALSSIKSAFVTALYCTYKTRSGCLSDYSDWVGLDWTTGQSGCRSQTRPM